MANITARSSLALLVAMAAAIAGCAPPPTAAGPASASPASSPTATPSATPAPSPRPDPPVVADDARALAQQLESAERAIRDARVSGADLAWWGHLQQLVYRRLVGRAELRDPVIAALPADLRPAAAANVAAGAELRPLVGTATQLPAWRIVDPGPMDVLLAHYRETEAEFGVPWSYLAAIHLIETRMGRIRGTSTAGAQGPMQFIPSTWAAYGEGDINNDRDAIRAAGRYLRANGAPGNMPNALFRYNPSDHYVRSVSAYADVMRADPAAYRGYYGWQVYYATAGGDVLLPVGYGR